MTHPDVPVEQAHVDRAYARLETMRATTSAILREAFSERGGTLQSLTERDIVVRSSLERLEHLQIGGEALVFGRIDRRDHDGEDEDEEVFHIGRLAVADERQDPLVVDWRAPVAEPFYRATGAHPMGLRLRRHFLTAARRVIDLEDERFGPGESGDPAPGGLSGPGALLAALERNRTGRMGDIVATVQREQDEIIRGPLSGVLVVEGGPGTGKTAVALHRAAYLLYTHRFPLERQGVLVVGPNPTFLRYIGQVLPSLGESGVELSTIAGLVPDLDVSAREPTHVAALKGEARMAEVLQKAVRDRERPLRSDVEIPFGHQMLRLTRQASIRAVNTVKRRAGTHNARRRALESLVWRELHSQIVESSSATSGQGGREDQAGGEPRTPAQLGRALRSTAQMREALERMWPLLSAKELLNDLFGAPALLDLAAGGILAPHEAQVLRRPRAAVASSIAWTQADVALVDEASFLLGARTPRRDARENDALAAYGHLVVDEAQDLSPMQLRMLARRSLSGSMTVVGDLAQATGALVPSSWEQIVEHLPTARGWRQTALSVNYRTPAEIMDLARRVLDQTSPGMQVPDAVRTGGEPPRIVTVAAYRELGVATGAAVSELLARRPHRGGTTAVIVPRAMLETISTALDRVGLQYGTASHGALDLEVSVLSVEDAKGLEFDDVVVVEPGLIARELGGSGRAVYVAMTRATRSLTVIQSADLALVPEGSDAGEGLPSGETGGTPSATSRP